MDRYLTLCILILGSSGIVVLGEYSSDAELASNTQRNRSDNSSWAKVCQMIAMPAHILLRTYISIDKGRVWNPRVRRLVFQLLAARISSFDSFLNLSVDSLLDFWLYVDKLRCDSPDILHTINQTPHVTSYIWRFTVSRPPL